MSLYEYRAVVASIYDADTLRLDIDCGFHVWLKSVPIRLLGLDAWELSGLEREKGLLARDALRQRLPVGAPVMIHTVKPSPQNASTAELADKYGRWLGTIWDDHGSVNEWLIEQGHAMPYMV